MNNLKNFFLTLTIIFAFISCKKTASIKDGTYFGTADVRLINKGYYLPTQRNIQVFVEINKNNTIDFTVKGITVAEGMPATDMKFTVLITKKSKSDFTLSSPKEGIIPVDMEGTPLLQYTIKDFAGNIEERRLMFSMLCNENDVFFMGKNDPRN